MEALLKIGHHDKATMNEFAQHMHTVLSSQAGDAVKIAALKSLADSLPVRNVTVSHCTLYGADREPKGGRDANDED